MPAVLRHRSECSSQFGSRQVPELCWHRFVPYLSRKRDRHARLVRFQLMGHGKADTNNSPFATLAATAIWLWTVPHCESDR
jgi:hypothetical protein